MAFDTGLGSYLISDQVIWSPIVALQWCHLFFSFFKSEQFSTGFIFPMAFLLKTLRVKGFSDWKKYLLLTQVGCNQGGAHWNFLKYFVWACHYVVAIADLSPFTRLTEIVDAIFALTGGCRPLPPFLWQLWGWRICRSTSLRFLFLQTNFTWWERYVISHDTWSCHGKCFRALFSQTF